MKINQIAPLRPHISVCVLLAVFSCLLLPTVIHSESATVTKNSGCFFRVYQGSRVFTSSSTGFSYTLYESYNTTTQAALIDGIDDSNGVPVTITSSSITVNNWNVPSLTVSFSASFNYSGGSDSISGTNEVFPMS
jgi:hypothetical protein